VFLAAAGIVAVAGFVHGLTGFGFALVATPVLTLLFDAKTAVLLSILLSAPPVITSSIVGSFLSLLPAAVLTVPVGAWAARRLPAARFRAVVTWAVLLSGLAILLRETSRVTSLLF
jgi:uncharacterized membrane protein YfcA